MLLWRFIKDINEWELNQSFILSKSSVTQEEVGGESLLLHLERSQLRLLGHLFQMPPGPREVFRACPTGRRPIGRPTTLWRDSVSASLCTPQDFPGRVGQEEGQSRWKIVFTHTPWLFYAAPFFSILEMSILRMGHVSSWPNVRKVPFLTI